MTHKLSFIINHGSFRSPKDDWIPWLSKELKQLNQNVITPQYPIDDKNTLKPNQPTKQNLKSWLKTFETQVFPKIKDQPVVL